MALPDIRVSIKLKKPVSGRKIMASVKKLVKERGKDIKYGEHFISQIEGNDFYRVGISSKFQYANMMVRIGTDLSETEITPKARYDVVGVGSSEEFLPGILYSVGYSRDTVVKEVNEIARGLAKLLIN